MNTPVYVTRKEKMMLEEVFVIRGVRKSNGGYTVVAEETLAYEPLETEIAEFLSDNPEVDFASVEHNYKLREMLPFE